MITALFNHEVSMKFNIFAFYIGIVLTAVGLLIGLPLLIWGDQNIGMYFLTMIAPLGFLLWFAGFIGGIALRPHEDRMQSDIDARKKAEEYQRTVPD